MIENALKGANLIREIVNAMNLFLNGKTGIICKFCGKALIKKPLIFF